MANGLAQTFYIDEPSSKLPGVYLTKLDLFFNQKSSDPYRGITVSINYVENGIPTDKAVPFSTVRIFPSNITTSDTGAVATTFVFEAPVFVQSEKEYAIFVSPDGGDIEYELWVSEVGGVDTVTNKQIFVNSSTGTLYTSTNGRQWTPYQNEDLKFRLHRASFVPFGTIEYTNANTEFIRVTKPIQNSAGSIIPGSRIQYEKIYVSNGNVVVGSNTLTSIGNTVINVYPANAQAVFAIDKMVYVRSNTAAQTDIRTIDSIPDSNTVVLNQSPTFNDSNATVGYLYANGGLYGTGYYAGGTDIILTNSTANSTVNFRSLLANGGAQSNALLIGELSGDSANLYNLVGVTYDEFVPQFAFTTVPGTTATINMKGVKFVGNVQTSTTLDSTPTTVIVDNSYKFIDSTRVVRSRSDELFYSSGAKSLQVTASVSTSNTWISPTFDEIKSHGLGIHNKVSFSNSSLVDGETQPRGGILQNKYISKPVLLTLEAEDLVVYLTAYRPLDTEVYVFCKLLNATDPDQFNSKYWTLMEEITPKPYSSKADLQDYRELQYKIPSGNNATTTTTAFVNTDNSNIVRYYTEDGSYYDGYNTYSIKIILAVTEDQTYIVPRVKDLRAIAVQV